MISYRAEFHVTFRCPQHSRRWQSKQADAPVSNSRSGRFAADLSTTVTPLRGTLGFEFTDLEFKLTGLGSSVRREGPGGTSRINTLHICPLPNQAASLNRKRRRP